MPIFGIKVSNIGKDVKTCDDEDLVMSSEINTLKTFTSATLEPNDTPITHDFGYTPIHLYAGYLSFKSSNIGFIGQNNDADLITNVTADTSVVSNDNMSGNAASALIYVFYDEL